MMANIIIKHLFCLYFSVKALFGTLPCVKVIGFSVSVTLRPGCQLLLDVAQRRNELMQMCIKGYSTCSHRVKLNHVLWSKMLSGLAPDVLQLLCD